MTNSIWWALIAQTAVIVAGVLVVLLFNHARFVALDKRIDDLRDSLRAEMIARFEGLEKLIRSEIQRLEDRIDRLEHPVERA